MEDVGFALDLVSLFMEENFVPAADFVIHVIKNVELAKLEDDFLTDMISFALCYCPEKEISFLVGELKTCIKSYGQTISADSILREHDFWINKACSAVSSLVKFDDIESVVAKMVKIPEKTITVSDKISEKISKYADTRIIWGGDETVQNFKKFLTKPRCLDLNFSNRYSFSIINSKKFNELNFNKILATGNSKQEAEKNAAIKALKMLNE